MKISFKGDYATKIILDLALTYTQGISQIKDISKRQDMPGKYLEQIITVLKNARYVNTVRGPRGGVWL
ncbi:MAG: RrF2 family transcriptional regulator, partial [Endomicrobiales bacterium]